MLMLSNGQSVITLPEGADALARLEKRTLTPSPAVQEMSRLGVVNAIKMVVYLGVYVQENPEYVLNKQSVFKLLDAYAADQLAPMDWPRLEAVVKTAADDVEAYGELNNLDEARLAVAAEKLATTPDTLLDLLNVILQHAFNHGRVLRAPALHFKIKV